MPVPTDITAGTLTITNGSTAVTGAGTSWLASDLRQGDVILWIEGGDGFQTPILADVPASNTALTLVEPWEGPTLTGVRYRIRYQWDSSRVSAQSRQLIELLDNGNILALASLTGPGVPVFDGPHSMTVRPTQDFINGVAYDVQVDTLPDRTAYDGQAAGFSVLVSDVGDGRSAVYSKASNASGDWTDPAYVTGPIGPSPAITAGTVTRGPLNVDIVSVGPGYELNFTVPVNVAQGDYSGVTPYLEGDIVQSAGSSWVALQDTTGNAPPSLPTTSNSYWQLLARAGNDGAGTVTTLVEGTGINVDSTDPTMPVISVDGPQATTLLDVFNTTRKGVVPQPSAGDSTAGRLLAANGAWVDPPTNADLEFTVAQLMMRLADIDNVAEFLGPNGNRFADSFDALTYVDATGATNLDTSTAGLLKPTVSLNRIAGGTPSSLFGGTPANFNDNNPATVFTTTGTIPNLVGQPVSARIMAKIDLGSIRPIARIEILNHYMSGGGATNALYTSSDNSTWTAYGVSFSVSPTPISPDRIANVNARYVALVLQDQGYGSLTISLGDMNVYEATANNLTVRSTSFSAPSAPTKMKALLNVREVDAAVAGTDYFIDVSRDGGTTWTAVTLTERYSLPSGLRVVEGAETDINAQPSGTAPCYRLRTANNKIVEFHDVYLYWRN